MTFFFFMVGLDVRRDLTLGELRNPRNAILPAAAAIGSLGDRFSLAEAGQEAKA